MLLGYARVSTQDQDQALQLDALERAGARRIWQEKQSATRPREQLAAMLDQLRAGDCVIVWRLDRLARSLRDLLDLAERIDRAGASLRSITEAFDTSTPAGRLAFAMLGAVAEFERALIRDRSRAGLAVARAAGVRMGRAPALAPHQAAQLLAHWRTGKYAKAELARMHGVSVSTVKRQLWRAGLDSLDQ